METFNSYSPAPSSEPRNVTVVNATSTTIHFSWQPPLTEDQNGVITGYILNVTSLVTGETEEVFTESTAYMLASVNPHTLYAASVAAQTNAGRGPFSALISVQTLEDGMLFTDIIQATLLISSIYPQNQVTHLSLSDILQLRLPLLTSPGSLHQLSTIMASSGSTQSG